MTGRPDRRRSPLVLLLSSLALFLISTTSATGQAVYGSVRGTITDASGGVLPGVSVTITSKDRNTSDTVVTDVEGVYRKERLLPGVYEVKAELQGFKQAVVSERGGRRRRADERRLQPGARRDHRERRGHRRSAAAQDRPRRRRDDLRSQAAHRPAGARPQLHQVHPADAGHAAASSGSTRRARTRRARRRRWSTGSTSAAPAISSTAPRTATRSSGSSSSTRRSSRSARRRSRRRTTTRSSARRRPAWSRCRPSRAATTFHGSAFEFYQSDTFQARNPFTQCQPNPLTGKFLPETQEEPVRRLGRRPDHRRTGCSSSATTRARRNTEGGSRLLTVPTAAARARRSERVRRQHLRSADRRTGSATQFPGNVIPARPAVAAGAGDPRADSAAERAGRRQRHARQLRRVRLGDVQRGLVQRPHRRPARRRARTCSAATAAASSSATARRRSAPAAARELVSLGGVSDVKNQSLAYGVDHAFSSHAAGRLPVRLLPVQRQRAAVRLRHDAGRRRRHPRPEPRQHVHLRSAGRFVDRNGDRGLQLRIGPRRQPLQLPARPGREAVAGGRQRHEAGRQPHASSSASTSGAPTTCACRATRTAPAS